MTIREADRALFSWVLDLLVLTFSLWFASLLRQVLPWGPEYTPVAEPPLSLYVLILLIWSVLFISLGIYSPFLFQKRNQAAALFTSHAIALLVLGALIYFLSREVSRYLFIYFAIASACFLSLWRWILWRQSANDPSPRFMRILIIGAGTNGAAAYARVRERYPKNIEVVGFMQGTGEKPTAVMPDKVPLLGDYSMLERVLVERHVDAVIIALEASRSAEVTETVTRLRNFPGYVYLFLDLSNLVLALNYAIERDWHLVDLPTSFIQPQQWLVKRFIDLFFSAAMLLISLPFWALIALAIKLDSPGPVFFSQRRIGEKGHPFRLYKFRSMIDGAEQLQPLMNRWTSDGKLIHKYRDDPRVTRVGRVLRRWSLDELPEFWNILLGDMSLVGPRPELPWIVETYEPQEYRRLLAPPGLTGYWQIKGRGEQLMHLFYEYDLYYIDHYSLRLDLWILFKTPFAVLTGRGAF